MCSVRVIATEYQPVLCGWDSLPGCPERRQPRAVRFHSRFSCAMLCCTVLFPWRCRGVHRVHCMLGSSCGCNSLCTPVTAAVMSCSAVLLQIQHGAVQPVWRQRRVCDIRNANLWRFPAALHADHASGAATLAGHLGQCSRPPWCAAAQEMCGPRCMPAADRHACAAWKLEPGLLFTSCYLCGVLGEGGSSR